MQTVTNAYYFALDIALVFEKEDSLYSVNLMWCLVEDMSASLISTHCHQVS